MKFLDESRRDYPYANVLLMGRPKQGKTTGACSAPGLVAYLNWGEPNAVELGHELYGDRIQEVDVQGISVKALLSEVMQSCYPADGNPMVDTWVCDPVGDLHRRLLKELSNQAVRPSRDTYGDVSTMVEDFLRFMCEAPCNFVIVAHDNATKPAEGEAAHPFTGTSNPAVGHKVMQMVDVIAYVGLVVDDDGRYRPMAQIVPTNERPVGVRGRFNRLLEDEEVRKSGAVDLNLTEWFRIADKYLGNTPEEAQAAA